MVLWWISCRYFASQCYRVLTPHKSLEMSRKRSYEKMNNPDDWVFFNERQIVKSMFRDFYEIGSLRKIRNGTSEFTLLSDFEFCRKQITDLMSSQDILIGFSCSLRKFTVEINQASNGCVQTELLSLVAHVPLAGPDLTGMIFAQRDETQPIVDDYISKIATVAASYFPIGRCYARYAAIGSGDISFEMVCEIKNGEKLETLKLEYFCENIGRYVRMDKNYRIDGQLFFDEEASRIDAWLLVHFKFYIELKN